MEPWTPGGDPMLALLPAEIPLAFQRLPVEEQRWRGRVFLIAYITTNNTLFAWQMALNPEPDASYNNRMDVEHTRDEVIVQGLRDLADLKAGRPVSA